MPHTNHETLYKLSTRMHWLCVAFAIFTLLAALYGIILGVTAPSQMLSSLGVVDHPETVGMVQIASTLVVNLVTAGFIAAGFWILAQLFNAFSHGDIFEIQQCRYMRQAGAAFLAAALWGILARSLSILILTANYPIGQRQLAVGIEMVQVMGVVLAGVLFAIGHVLTLGIQLQNENKEFV